MARGRKKDMTIPTTRSLVQQRAYRDRRAKYISDLEERCRHAETENERLRQELATAKAGTPGENYDRNLLMEQLTRTQETLTRFQQMTSTNIPESRNDTTAEIVASFLAHSFQQSNARDAHGQAFERAPTSTNAISMQTEDSSLFAADSATPARAISETESECCGGLLDCRGLVEEHAEVVPGHFVHEQVPRTLSLQRTSSHRSTLHAPGG
ncbi:hypothetical protein EW146_g183 [Bondarzewia mesenterica]|uniref:BZIP domain-containing protein n=1 Tax=Bondarzewia mesenterica TaxID=1095465 RepID=A0A4S4M894_9AGAM|nr:hypothetical protein EW146_g183 [Bondarzewia mesenterica]